MDWWLAAARDQMWLQAVSYSCLHVREMLNGDEKEIKENRVFNWFVWKSAGLTQVEVPLQCDGGGQASAPVLLPTPDKQKKKEKVSLVSEGPLCIGTSRPCLDPALVWKRSNTKAEIINRCIMWQLQMSISAPSAS